MRLKKNFIHLRSKKKKKKKNFAAAGEKKPNQLLDPTSMTPHRKSNILMKSKRRNFKLLWKSITFQSCQFTCPCCVIFPGYLTKLHVATLIIEVM